MEWVAFENDKTGESYVLDVKTNQIVARIASEPFQGMYIATLMASAPYMLESINRFLHTAEKYVSIQEKLLNNLTYDVKIVN